MSEIISKAKIADVDTDISNIGKSANELGHVNPRYGNRYKTIPQLSMEFQQAVQDALLTGQNLQQAINTALAAGAGEAGWTASLVVNSSGETQQEINDNQEAFNKTLPIVIDKVADMAAKKNTLIGQLVQTRGFHTKSDGGGADYVVREKGSLIVDGVTIVQLGNSDRVAVMLDLDKKVDIRRFGVKVSSSAVPTSDLVDQTSAVQLAFDKAVNIVTPDGRFKVTASITVNKRMTFLGQSMFKTMIYFDPADEFTPLFTFIRGANCGTYADFLVRGNSATKSGTFVKMIGNISDGDFVYKNEFRNIACYEISLFVEFTATNPLNGTTHAHCDSNLFINCRLGEVKRYVINRNIQAVNNWFINCDLENGAIDDSSMVYIKDEAGAGMHFQGGSIIGKGKLYEWVWPSGGTTIFAGSTVEFKSLRLECRPGHNGVIINEGVSPNPNSIPFLNIIMKDVTVNVFGQNLDLLRYSGRINASFDNVKTPTLGNNLSIRQYPTIERSSGQLGRGGYGKVTVEDSSVVLLRELNSPYGTYNPAYTSPMTIRNGKSGAAAGLDTDSVGFSILQTSGNLNFFGAGYNDLSGFGKLVLASESPNMPLYGTQKVRLKANTRMLKFGFYSPVTSRAVATTAALYIVKDNANWANPASLNLATDAFKIAELTSPVNGVGLYETPINTELATNIPSNGKVGATGWLEGRIAITFSADMQGFAYVEYC